jgi:signal transduction histidine kinase
VEDVREAERRRIAGGLRDVLAVINSTESIDAILDRVLAQAVALVGIDAGALYLRDPFQPDLLRLQSARDVPEGSLPAAVPLGTPLMGLAVARRRPVMLADFPAVIGEPLAASIDEQLEDRGDYLEIVRPGPVSATDPGQRARNRLLAAQYPSVLCVPLVAHDEDYGAIVLYCRNRNAFSLTCVQLAEAFAQHSVLAVQNVKLRAQAEQRLEELEQRRRVSETLRDLVAIINSGASLDETLDEVLREAGRLLGSDAGAVYVRDDRDPKILKVQRAHHLSERVMARRVRVGWPVTGLAVLTGRPVVCPDRLAMLRRPTTDEEDDQSEDRGAFLEVVRPIHLTAFDPEQYQVSRDMAPQYPGVVSAPLASRGYVYGAITLFYAAARTFTDEEVVLVAAFAEQVGLAIENAHLRRQSERRLRDLEALYRADESLYRSLRLEDVLQALVDVAGDILQAGKIAIYLRDERTGLFSVRAGRGLSEALRADLFTLDEVRIADAGADDEVVEVDDLDRDTRLSPHLRDVCEREGCRAWITSAIRDGQRLLGTFSVGYEEPRVFGADERRLLQALSQRAGLAIQNARLFEQAQQAAMHEERQRLARELHDAVTQTLFSASLIAEVTPRLWERDPVEGRRRLEELRRLTRGALAEMRALLVELRPGALVEVPLGHLLRQLADATISRSGLAIEVRVDGERELRPDVQVGLYRIAQEALNNVVKHAQAQRVDVRLATEPHGVDLSVRDDGQGFDPASVPPGHLGLGIMRERALAIGAQLDISNHGGSGTCVLVSWHERDAA